MIILSAPCSQVLLFEVRELEFSSMADQLSDLNPTKQAFHLPNIKV